MAMAKLQGEEDFSEMAAPAATPSLYAHSSGSQRKERGAIAAQACDTCRSRKQKCDEQRPCGTCQKFGLECNYREPQPTKKDKTLVEILERIRSLEGKVDNLNSQGGFPAPAYDPVHSSIHTPVTPLATTAPIIPGPGPPSHGHAAFGSHASSFHSPDMSRATSFPDGQYKYASSIHQMLAWPAVQKLLLDSVGSRMPYLDPSAIQRDGLSSVLALNNRNEALPADVGLEPLGSVPMGLGVGSKASAAFVSGNLNLETMQRLSKAYFSSFNLLYPILDQQAFTSETLPSVYQNGFNDGMESALVFLVFALGEVAVSDSRDPPIQVYNGRPSGVKGGTMHHPPGLALFNEARKRMGFNLTECSLENVQIFALASLYYGTCFRHMEFWRMTTLASLACQALIRSNSAELSSPRAYLVKRAFWHCFIMETCLSLELSLSMTGLEKLETAVGIPDFTETFSEDGHLVGQGSLFREYFASQIVLLRLLSEYHNDLSQASAVTTPVPGPLQAMLTTIAMTMPTALVSQNMIERLVAPLEQWRGMLPPPLRWQDDTSGTFTAGSSDPYSGSSSASIYSPAPPQPGSPSAAATTAAGTPLPPHSSPTIASPPMLVFTADLDSPPVTYPFVLDIQAALLRSRYYHAKHLAHRPFVYKVLHHHGSLTSQDTAGAATCLRAGLAWPLALSPARFRKRLVPCALAWSQNMLAVLLLLRLSESHPMLRRVRSLCGERFETEARETVRLYLDWLRDLRAVDPAARWCWAIVRTVYGLEE